MTNNRLTILIVDDEPNMLHMLSTILEHDGFAASCASNAREALELADGESFDFILSDVRMPGMDGIQLLEELRNRNIDSIVILMSAYGTVDLAMEAMRKGAYDYISKPFKTDEVVLTLRKAAERERLRREVVSLKHRLVRSEGNPAIVAESEAMKHIMATVRHVAPYDSSVLITGPSGTGKEVVAREIHRRSGNPAGPFVAVNCAALPGELLESELFGHARGAFTGAAVDKPGLFEVADGGTIFLDEIGSMDPSLQVKLLRALDSGEIRRVGENRRRRVTVRTVSATNEDLEKALSNSAFREDLFYRISVVHIAIPPLKERRDDVLPLVEHFVSLLNEKTGRKVKHITTEAQTALLNYSWPGNVRELQNVIERAMILTGSDSITLESLPVEIRRGESRVGEETDDENDLSMKKATKDLEKKLIIRALNRTAGNRTRAAELLGISYPSMLQKIKQYGLS